jgi:hypothetical protein
LSAPAVSPLGACEVDRVASLSLADKHAIPHYNGIHTLVCGVGYRVAVYGVKARINAFATRAHKEYYNHTDCQE